MTNELSEKICLITGATSGIGKETAIALANKGVTLAFTSSDIQKGKIVLDEIINKTGNQNVKMYQCDLSSFESIREFIKVFQNEYSNLQILINNAGVWEVERKLSKDGIEKDFAINHLAPFLLTNLLLPLLIKSGPARIVNVASTAHFRGRINFDDLEFKNKYDDWAAYSQSKLANILFTKKLSKILEGTSVTANCLHPGVVATNLLRNMNIAAQLVFKATMISPKKGAGTTIYLASSHEVEKITGEYFSKCKITKSSPESYDMKTADRLWEISRKYCNI